MGTPKISPLRLLLTLSAATLISTILFLSLKFNPGTPVGWSTVQLPFPS